MIKQAGPTEATDDEHMGQETLCNIGYPRADVLINDNDDDEFFALNPNTHTLK